MEATTALVLVLGSLFVGITLLLALGYVDTEKERARQAAAREAGTAMPAAAMAAEPRFFASAQAVSAPPAVVFDDALVGKLEDHLRVEQALLAQFVHNPSIDNLYRQTGAAVHVH